MRSPLAQLATGRAATEAVLALIRATPRRWRRPTFGAIFDSRRLGYRSALCALHAPAAELPRIAEVLASRPGRHALLSAGADLHADGPCPNLWFTLAAPAGAFAQRPDALRAACSPYAIDELPACRRPSTWSLTFAPATAMKGRPEKPEPT